jgi:hypothetical protein
MPESFGSVFGFLLNTFKVVSHILLLLVHNLIFIAIAVALLYGIFKLGRFAVRQTRRALGEQPRALGEQPEESRPAADQSQYARGQSSSTIKQGEPAPGQVQSVLEESKPSPEGNLPVPPQSEPAQEQSQVAGKGESESGSV